MAAIIGSGLDELMRHNPSLKTKCFKGIVLAMHRIVDIGKKLVSDEDKAVTPTEELETSRTCLIQYSSNIVQLLEQIIHSEDHVAPFISAGGFDALLDMSRWTATPGGRALVANVTCLSAPSAASITHSSTSKTLAILVRAVCSNTTDPSKLIKSIIAQLDTQLIDHSKYVKDFTKNENMDALICDNLLERVPAVPLHDLEETNDNLQLVQSLSCLFRSFNHIDWLANCLANSFRIASQRANELGSSIGREREWKKEIASKSFENLMSRLYLLQRSSLFEVCRVRSEPGFNERDEARSKASEKPLVYKIRIVCQEGAIVRNGIDIDRCDSMGNMEMGEIVHAYDRCINSSGVLRYQTSRGWVSELTRGHGKEIITEVVDINVLTSTPPPLVGNCSAAMDADKRGELGLPDLKSTAAFVVARLQQGNTSLLQCFSMIHSSGVRAPRVISFQNKALEPHVIAAAKILTTTLRANFEHVNIKSDDKKADGNSSMEDDDKSDDLGAASAKCMYLGSQVSALQASLYEEKRGEQRGTGFNLPLMISLLVADGWKDGIFSVVDEKQQAETDGDDGIILSAIRFILLQSLRDMATFAAKERTSQEQTDTPKNIQRMSRAVAASLPPTLTLLRKLMSRPLLIGSITSAHTLTKMKPEAFASLIPTLPTSDDAPAPQLNTVQFARALHLKLAKLSFEVFANDKFASVPSHIINPWMQHLSDILRTLEEASKAVTPPPAASTTGSGSSLGSSLLGGRLPDPNSRSGRLLASMGLLPLDQEAGVGGDDANEPEVFEPSEESISQLAEMGFSRDHAEEALEMAGTNRVEVAMEYALTVSCYIWTLLFCSRNITRN